MKIVKCRSNNLFPVFRPVEDMFDRFFRGDFFSEAVNEDSFLPSIDLATEGDDFLVSVELPGVKPEDIQLNLDKGVLTIAGEKKSDREDEGKNYYRRESATGRFVRKISLPSEVDSETIKATFENGVLQVRIKKAESAKPKTIAIEAK